MYVRALIPDCYNRRKFKPHYSSRMYLIEQNNRTMRKVHNGRIARLPFRQVVTQILDNTAIPVATVNSF